jgi:hypothetical protein
MAEEISGRFAALVERELGAAGVRLLSADEPASPRSVCAALPDGRRVEAIFDEPPPDREATTRRLEMLAGAFEEAVLSEGRRARRIPPAVSLEGELRALVLRSGGAATAVIDAHSPVIWAKTEGGEEPAAVLLSDALGRARALPQMAELHKGGHLAYALREEGFGLLVRSFAGIYALVVAFDHAFDEIRAERAVRDALPRIERLVLALPPLDPDPLPAGVVALRRRRRR